MSVQWTKRDPGAGDMGVFGSFTTMLDADDSQLEGAIVTLTRVRSNIDSGIRGGSALALTTTLERVLTDLETFHDAVVHCRSAIATYVTEVEAIQSAAARQIEIRDEAALALSATYMDSADSPPDDDELRRRERLHDDADDDHSAAERKIGELAEQRQDADNAILKTVAEYSGRLVPLDLDELNSRDRGWPFDATYGYEYQYAVGNVGQVSAEDVMDVFKANPGAIFPFDIEGADTLEDGDTIRLVGAIPGPNGSGTVHVSTTPTSVTFTVVSDDYFDGTGSTITFKTEEQDGLVYLHQIASAHDALDPVAASVDLGAVTNFAWNEQADNLRDLLPKPDKK